MSPGYGQQRKQAGTYSRSGASLSVVVVSSGSPAVAHRAAQALDGASRDLAAQVILVSQSNDPTLATSVERSGAEFVVAPSGSSRAEMCDLGMSRVLGTIVAVRDDFAIGNAAWLDTYRMVLKRSNAPVPVPTESVVMDTLVAARGVLADSSDPRTSLVPTADSGSIGVATAV
jgi:hypothetical protein